MQIIIQFACCPTFHFFQPLLDISNCDGNWFLHWLVAMTCSQNSEPLRIMNLETLFLLYCIIYWWLSYYYIIPMRLRIHLGWFLAFIFLISTSLMYLLSLIVSAMKSRRLRIECSTFILFQRPDVLDLFTILCQLITWIAILTDFIPYHFENYIWHISVHCHKL